MELPASDPRTTLATAEQICRDLIAGGLGGGIRQKFPALTEEQLQGMILTWNEGQFQSGKSVFIMTGINYREPLPQAKDIADYCESKVRDAVSTKFAEPATPSPR